MFDLLAPSYHNFRGLRLCQINTNQGTYTVTRVRCHLSHFCLLNFDWREPQLLQTITPKLTTPTIIQLLPKVSQQLGPKVRENIDEKPSTHFIFNTVDWIGVYGWPKDTECFSTPYNVFLVLIPNIYWLLNKQGWKYAKCCWHEVGGCWWKWVAKVLDGIIFYTRKSITRADIKYLTNHEKTKVQDSDQKNVEGGNEWVG